MDYKYPKNLLIPGYAFNVNVQRTHFPRVQQFQLNNNIASLVERPLAKAYGKPASSQLISVYLRQKCLDLPAWVSLDKKALCFDAYYQEPVAYSSPAQQIRICKIYFYLEDGTMKVFEPEVENSGIPQGTLLSRQRVPFPTPKEEQFYDLIDLNVGKEIEIYGRIFKLINCDAFTRKFLVRLGIFVPDAIEAPADPLVRERKKEHNYRLPKKPCRKNQGHLQMLEHDCEILSFKAFWDDRSSEYGYVHELKVHYFLSDGTMEILEMPPASDKGSSSVTFVKRSKVPKFYTGLHGPGYSDRKNMLNLCRIREDKYNVIYDRLGVGCSDEEYFQPQDLAIGTVINVYGRKIILADCDSFTKKFYQNKYGLDDFNPIPTPETEKPVEFVPLLQRKLPPWNGFGSYEDSAQNCITVEPKQIMRDAQKFYALDRDGGDSRILRFRAVLLEGGKEAPNRNFMICYYLVDDNISVHESIPNTCTCTTFLRKQKMPLPGEEIFGSDPPKYYKPSDMYVGATINVNGFIFKLIDADEYAFRYMELHPSEFPKANLTVIMNKVRERLKPTFKDFIGKNVLEKSPIISYTKLDEELREVMGEDWTQHEMITLGRHFAVAHGRKIFTREYVRQLVQTRIRKSLWNELDRLKEYFLQRDVTNSGYLPTKDVYNLIKASRVPLTLELIQQLLDVLRKNEKGEIDCQDLFLFLDETVHRVPDAILTSVAHNPCNVPATIPRTASLINWCAFSKELDLDDTFNEN